ncbi:MAG: hypothetical protein WA102_11460 [Candidatus Methanoperedens sp.]
MNAFAKLRLWLGWCPQKKIVYRTEDEFISDYACSSTAHANDNTIHKGMDVPLQMFDWRIWAIFCGFIVLILSVSAWIGTYSYLFPSSFILIALLFLFFHTKLSVGSETLRITTPILGDIVIPKNSIKSIEIFENYANKHKLRSLVPLILFFILLIFNAVTMQNPIMKKMSIIAIFLFIFVFYASIHISKYPRMIRIHAGRRDIVLYPRNENDFLKLKDIVPGKSG